MTLYVMKSFVLCLVWLKITKSSNRTNKRMKLYDDGFFKNEYLIVIYRAI